MPSVALSQEHERSVELQERLSHVVVDVVDVREDDEWQTGDVPGACRFLS